MSSTNLVKNNLFTKPYLLTLDELSQIGQNMNLVGYDPQLNITSDDTNIVLKYGVPSSPKILNWVEPYKIAGIDYTLFYTEVNSGLNIGDRVFIINGTYDSNLLIQADKYKKGHDGYKVLFIDKCKVVLDIEFTGSLPSNETTANNDDFDDFIKVYYVKDENDFLHVNRQITTRVSGNMVDFKFNKHQNNLIFVDNPNGYSGTSDNWGQNGGLSTTGFFIKNGTSSWIEISNDFMTGSYSIAATNSNDKILILNNSFTYTGVDFKENSVYSWQYNTITATYSWMVNVKHENNNVPILTKSNFRDGTFNGTWNGGLYGSNEKRITWGSTTSFWNHGTLLNTIWEKGIMESKYSQTESYIAEFDKYGIPYQKSTNPDNDGYGYNFVINSEIRNAVINNGNVSNSVLLGTGTAANISIVEDHIRGNLTDQYIKANFNNTLINKAYFESCGIQNANIENAVIKNSRVENSRLYSVKSINTHYKSSLFKNSNYISDNIIKILDFDQFEYSSDASTVTHLVYKFYINKRSYEKFKFKDNFYIKGIKLNNSVNTTTAIFSETEPIGNSILNFFDKKFKIGPWTEYIDTLQNYNFIKTPIQFNSFVSTAKENQYTYYVSSNISNYNYTGINDNNKGYSLDIFIKLDTTISPSINKYSVNFKDIIDFSNAYIQNSDFESGVVENSNWNSGHHINFNNKNGLVKMNSNTSGYFTANNVDGQYDISRKKSLSTGITSSLVLNNIHTVGVNDEFELDYLKVNDIVFLNAVDYDSRGTVTGITIINGGSGYTTSTGLITSYSGNGRDLKVDIISTVIGGVLGLSYSVGSGNGYDNGAPSMSGIYYPLTTTGMGSGLVLNITRDNSGILATFSISNIGQGYNVGDTIEVQTSGASGIFKITSVTNGEVISASVSVSGLFYEIGDIVNITTGDGLAQVKVTGITGSLTRLPDAYKVTNMSPFIIDEIVATGSTSLVNSLLEVGLFSSYDANNRYGYLHKTKFYKSKIVSGLFRRAYIKGSLIKNDSVDISDKDFTNIEKLKSLIIADTIFSKNDNILSNAFYIFSSFVNGTDIWDNGILFRSIWNGMTFNNGLVRESTWLDGIFNNGLFYLSDLPYNLTTDLTNPINLDGISPYYNSNNIYSYYKSGLVDLITNNNRLSWQKGQFVNGEFYKSKWENGSFNGGKFYYSDFYSGEFNGGIIGDKSLSSSDTRVFNGDINYTTVENANLITNYTDFVRTVPTRINWYDGIFNDGVFSTYGTNSVYGANSATWYNGTFNGGEFGSHNIDGIPKWKDGIFNGGKFTSIYGTSSTPMSTTASLDDVNTYAWEKGTFNGGEFGFLDNNWYNSTWFDGTFNGGKFKGKVWNNGIFTFGEFLGGVGGTYSGQVPIGGTANIATQSNANNFVKSFIDNNNQYYGLWRDGFVTDTKSKYLDEEIFTDLKRTTDTNKSLPFSLLKNVLWQSGTFSHPSATIQNSVWLDGTFENGTFENSAFNPYAVRTLGSSPTFNFNDSCHWINGNFKSGEFSISTWENGNFIYGTATGMIWKKGIVNYMNAYNVFWEDGLWKNGNWEGSYYTINPDGTVTDPYVKQILNRGMSWSGTSSCHIWSVFYKESLTQFANVSPINSGSVVHHPDSTENQPPLPPNQFGIIGAGTTPPPVSGGSNKVLGSITWGSGGSADLVGTNLSVSTLFTSVDTYNSVTWEVYSGTNWTTGPTITLPFTGTSQQFNLQPGVNKFRVKGTNPDNNQVYYTNVLTYTKTVAAYVISSSINSDINFTSTVSGTITVNVAPVTLTLKAVTQSNNLYTSRGIATITLNGTNINGSPFDTDYASGSSPVKSISIHLTSQGTYNVSLQCIITGGSVRLT